MPDPTAPPRLTPPRLIETIPYALGMDLVHYRLANGLHIYLMADPSVPVVSVQTWVNVGARHEVKGKTGLAHFFEHLMFGATNGYGEGEFTSRLEAIGAQINAATSNDWTHFYVNAEKAHLPMVLDLEAERLVHLALTPEAVAREREVVANERRERVDDDLLGGAMELLDAMAFSVHPYGHPTVGLAADIEAYNTADCEAFYRTYYAPNNVTLVIVGDIVADEALAMIVARYGAMPAASIPVEDTWPEPPHVAERRAMSVVTSASERALIAYPGPARCDDDHLVGAILIDALAGGDASILEMALVHTEIATTVGAWETDTKDPGVFLFYLDAPQGKPIGPILASLDAALDRVVHTGITAERLAQVKARLALRIAQRLQSASERAYAIGEDAVGGGCVTTPAQAMRRIDAVTLADVRRVARRYLVPTARSIVQIIPSNPGAAAPVEAS